MNKPIDDSDLDRSLRAAFAGRPELTFADWRVQNGQDLGRLGRHPAAIPSTRRSQIMKWSLAALMGLVVVSGIWMFQRGGNADRVFAQALEQAAKANTLSAEESGSYTVNGTREGFHQRTIFKQPNLARREIIQDGQATEITITDYAKRRQLSLKPASKEAWISDWTNVFEIDPATGKFRPEKLHTSLREDLLSLQARAVKDLGEVELSGRKVRLLQSANDSRVVKVWTDPDTRRPLQVTVTRPNSELVYSSIKIDEELPDDLFSLEPPEDYKVSISAMGPERVGQLYAKAMYLALECCRYYQSHGNSFPNQLSDLGLKPDVLQNLQTLPGGGHFEYVRPQAGTKLPQTILVYEAYDTWPEQGIVAGFGDAHAAHIPKEEMFKQLLNGQR